ncbi:MAG TPA: hypothetical protein DEA96_11295 [Leptospiraceae bacterium]|nr:hypothetical protein [Spirochaetaceae bacterium]HBS05544.1 hypothetical protein [Leptospiraceae bacterium]|tara:strand:+ start:62463 stop:63317 length:855 start_codon:yes stop_codon:yes gene_type:complete
MSERYHYLISGLPDLYTADQGAERELDRIQSEILELLEGDDARQFQYLLYRNDNKNLLRLIRDRQGIQDDSQITFHRPAAFSHQDLEEGILGLLELPEYMQLYLEEMDLQKHLTLFSENRLIELYYEEAISNTGPFLSGYFSHKRDVKNIISAINARRDGMELANVVVGDTDLNRQLIQSNLPDFGLSQLYPFITEVRELIEQRQLNDLERRIDSLILDYIQENSMGHEFDEVAVFAYFLELSLASRWLDRSVDLGRDRLREIVKKVLSNSALPEQVRADELAL